MTTDQFITILVVFFPIFFYRGMVELFHINVAKPMHFFANRLVSEALCNPALVKLGIVYCWVCHSMHCSAV